MGGFISVEGTQPNENNPNHTNQQAKTDLEGDDRNKPKTFVAVNINENAIASTTNTPKDRMEQPKVINPEIEKMISEGLMFGDKVDAVKKVKHFSLFS